jgi:hypothetical protein
LVPKFLKILEYYDSHYAGSNRVGTLTGGVQVSYPTSSPSRDSWLYTKDGNGQRVVEISYQCGWQIRLELEAKHKFSDDELAREGGVRRSKTTMLTDDEMK